MRVRELVGTAVMALLLLSASGARAEEALEETKNPWRGSALSYEHSALALSFAPHADPTWNPNYVHTLSLAPTWHFGDTVVVRGSFMLEQELTNSDDTVQKNEWVWSDVNLDVSPEQGWTESETGIRLNGGVRFQIPLSKMSAAQKLNLGIAPAASLSRKFDVMNGLTVRYGARWQFNWHRNIYPGYDGPTIMACSGVDSAECGAYMYNGHPSVANLINHGPAVSFSPIEKLTLNAEFSFRRASVHTITDYVLKQDGTGPVTLPGSSAVRYFQMFRFEAAYNLFDFLDLSAGVLSMYQDTKLDGTYQTPFINRFTTVFLGLSIDADGLLSQI